MRAELRQIALAVNNTSHAQVWPRDLIENQILTFRDAPVPGSQVVPSSSDVRMSSELPQPLHQRINQLVGCGFVMYCDVIPDICKVITGSLLGT